MTFHVDSDCLTIACAAVVAFFAVLVGYKLGIQRAHRTSQYRKTRIGEMLRAAREGREDRVCGVHLSWLTVIVDRHGKQLVRSVPEDEHAPIEAVGAMLVGPLAPDVHDSGPPTPRSG